MIKVAYTHSKGKNDGESRENVYILKVNHLPLKRYYPQIALLRTNSWFHSPVHPNVHTNIDGDL